MLLINCEISLRLSWYLNAVISSSIKAATFTITDVKLHVPVINLLTQYNSEILTQSNQDLSKQLLE